MKISQGNSTYLDMWYHGFKDNKMQYSLTCHYCSYPIDAAEYAKGGRNRLCPGCGKYLFQNKRDYEAFPEFFDAIIDIDWMVPNNE